MCRFVSTILLMLKLVGVKLRTWLLGIYRDKTYWYRYFEINTWLWDKIPTFFKVC